MNLADELARLQRLTTAQLRDRYADVFGEPTGAGNKAWLIKRIAWRLQALAEGDLSQRARQRAQELANDADLRLSPPKTTPTHDDTYQLAPAAAVAADQRLPPPGSILNRLYKGKLLQVTILDKGFAFEGVVYRSLSAVAKAITGSHCNGFLFFRCGTNNQETTP
jgi:Protein of unknown function (DUF2924)